MRLEDVEGLVEDEGRFTAWYDGLSADDQSQVDELLADAPRIGPQPGPQSMAFYSEADVLGYGGAAGGGKSALIALLTLLSHHRTVIFRRDSKQLKGLVDDLVKFHGTDDGLNRTHGSFRFTGGLPGHLCEWGGIGQPGEENNWKGRAHDFNAFDEATEVLEAKVRFLETWNRSAEPGQRCRTVMTFNPPGSPDDPSGSEGRWVIKYFAPWLDERHPNPAKSGELRYFMVDSSGEEIEVEDATPRKVKVGDREIMVEPQSRTFIAASVVDNAYLRGGKYEQKLLGLQEPYRSMLYLGDFRSGIVDSPMQVIPTEWVDAAMDRWSAAESSGEGRRIRTGEAMDSMGMDVARGGRDFTVLAPRRGWYWDRLLRMRGKDTPDGATAAGFAAAHVRDGATICIDAIGIGTSPYDRLREMGARVVPVVGSKRKGLVRFAHMAVCHNLRSSLYWMMRGILDPSNGLDAMLPPDNRLRSDLLAPMYSSAGGTIKVESKLEVVKRLGHSPDDSDAVVYSLMDADTDGVERVVGHRRKVNTELLYRSIRRGGTTWQSV